MKNKGNGMMSATTTTSSPGGTTPSANTLKNYFKTPEGRYKLLFDKSHPSLLHSSPSKSLSLVTLAHLKEKQTPTLQASTSSASVASGVRSAAARLYGSKSLSLAGGNAGNKYGGFASRSGSTGSSCWTNPNYDGKGTYLIFNVGDTIFISDLNCHDKDPIKSIHFSNSNPTCHAFDPNAKDGHDLLIGMSSGDIYSVSLRQQLHDLGKKLVGAHLYNKDGSTNNSRCTSIAWVPKGEGAFVVAHADGNLYVYEKNKDNVIDNPFPTAKDQTQFSVVHARTSKSNPTARWHICQGSINSMAFSNDGVYIATVGRDGYLRVFDFLKEQLICGGKSYYGALLCCAWSGDGKYILTGGEDDLVQVWSMEDRKVVAWGEGHGSWVSGVAFDPYWTPPTSEDTEESVLYRFGSVGQDTQLLLWDLEMNEIVVPLRRGPGGSPLGGSPSYSSSSQSSHWDNTCPVGTLQPSPSMRDVPKLSPVLTHRVHTEPLSGVVFTQDFVLTACREGHTKVWTRPGCMEKKSTSSESTLNVGSRDKQTAMVKNGPLSNR